MDINFFTTNLDNPGALIPAIEKEWKPYFQDEAFKNYEPEFHKVNKVEYRQEKPVYRPTPGSSPDPLTGELPHQWSIEKVTRLSLSIQKDIVKKAVAFLTGGPMSLKLNTPDPTQTSKDLYAAVSKTWSKNKLDFKNAPLAKNVMHQLEVAEVWYSDRTNPNDGQMRVKFFMPSDGYEFFPVFDRGGDLIAFGMKYDALDAQGNKIYYFDLWDANKFHRYASENGSAWYYRNDLGTFINPIGGATENIPNPIPHNYGKIPVIYWTLPKAPYQDVQTLIDQLEKTISNFCDTNEYNGSPILFTKGQIASLPTKGEAGKAVQGLDPESDVKYISIDSDPQMIRFETEFLEKRIYSLTDTPDISFEAMKGLGDISGAAFDRIFMGAHIKAIEGHTGWYGEGMQRRINFLIAALSAVKKLPNDEDLEIIPSFSLFRLNGLADDIDLAMKANGGLPVLTQKESISLAGASEDPEQTAKELEQQSADKIAQAQQAMQQNGNGIVLTKK